MDFDLKIYNKIGLDLNHIETLDKLYGCVIDRPVQETELKKGRFGSLNGYLSPRSILEASVIKPVKKIKAFANRVLSKGKKL